MSTTGFYHGIQVIPIDSNLRPIETRSTCDIFLLGTAPDADPSVFPLNTPVALYGRSPEMQGKLGYRGTLGWSLDGIFDNSPGARVIVARIPKAPTPKTSVLLSWSNPVVTINETVTRGTGDTDELAQDEIARVNTITMGDDTFIRGVDWIRDGNFIRWLSTAVVESVYRRSSTVDPLDHQYIIDIEKVFAGETVYVEGTDYRLHSTGGVEWLAGGHAPTPHTEYFVQNRYGRRPALNNNYVVNYTHYVNPTVTGETVVRSPTSDVDYLQNANILDINRLVVGNTAYVRNTDFRLENDGIHWLTTTHTVTLTRGATSQDAIPNTFILDVSSVQQGVDIFTKNVDWRLTSDGKIEWLTSNKPDENETYDVNYSRGHRPAAEVEYVVDYSYKSGEITAMSEAVGGINDEGMYEGVYAALASQSELGLKPKILIAPGFTQYVAVTAEMLGIAEQLRAIVVADGPNTVNAAAIQFRNEFNSKRLYIVDPWVKFYNTVFDKDDIQPCSARVAGIFNRSDNEVGFWKSPSNETINGITGIARPIPDAVAQHLNENAVATVRRFPGGGGYQLFGNRTPYADKTNLQINYTRTDDAIAEAIEMDLVSLIDKPINRAYFDLLAGSIAAFLRNLAQNGAIFLGDRSPVWINPDDNPPSELYAGKVKLSMDYSFVPAAEHIMILRYIESEYLRNAYANSPYVRTSNG